MNVEVNKSTQRGCNNCRKMPGVLCDKRIPPNVKGKIHKMTVHQARLCGMQALAPVLRY